MPARPCRSSGSREDYVRHDSIAQLRATLAGRPWMRVNQKRPIVSCGTAALHPPAKFYTGTLIPPPPPLSERRFSGGFPGLSRLSGPPFPLRIHCCRIRYAPPYPLLWAHPSTLPRQPFRHFEFLMKPAHCRRATPPNSCLRHSAPRKIPVGNNGERLSMWPPPRRHRAGLRKIRLAQPRAAGRGLAAACRVAGALTFAAVAKITCAARKALSC